MPNQNDIRLAITNQIISALDGFWTVFSSIST